MPTILITTDFLEVERELNVLQEGLGTKALQQAMNRTIERGRTEMTRGITAEFNVKAGDARAQMRLNKVTTSCLARGLRAPARAPLTQRHPVRCPACTG